MSAAEILHEVALERLNLRTQDIPPVPEHAESGLTDSLIDLRAETAQVKKRNRHREW
jgi:hypothetical protein